jgi:HK97 family phage major capsid protein
VPARPIPNASPIKVSHFFFRGEDSMSWQTIKRLNEERGVILGNMKAILNTAEGEKRELTADENAKFDALNAQAEAKLAEARRHEQVRDIEERGKTLAGKIGGNDAAGAAGGAGEQRTDADAKAAEQRAELNRYLRGQIRGEEVRALSVGGIGVVGDRPFYTQLVESMKAFAGVLEAGASVLTTSNGNPLIIGTSDDTGNTGQIVAEATTSTTAADPTDGNKSLDVFKFDSKWIKVSTELLQDGAFDVEGHVNKVAGVRIGRALNTYTTTGSGTAQPKGFVTAASNGKVAASTSAITYEELVDLFHSVDAAYRSKGVWQLNDLTLAAIRKLKDGDNRYIFSPGESGQPGTILGKPYVTNNDMALLSAGVSSKVVAFGDFSTYFVRNVTQPWIVVAKELFAADGVVGYRIFSRHGGNLADVSAVKLLALAAS